MPPSVNAKPKKVPASSYVRCRYAAQAPFTSNRPYGGDADRESTTSHDILRIQNCCSTLLIVTELQQLWCLVTTPFSTSTMLSMHLSRENGDSIDSQFGFDRVSDGPPRLGWLLNYLPITFPDECDTERSALDLYFLDREGNSFKATMCFDPYFYVVVDDDSHIAEVSNLLQNRYNTCRVEVVEKEDLDMQNHLSGTKRKLLKLIFLRVSDLQEAKSSLWSIISMKQKYRRDGGVLEKGGQHENNTFEGNYKERKDQIYTDPLLFISEMREFDVPYTMRVSIDNEIRVGSWYIVTPEYGCDLCSILLQKDMIELCEPKILAFDIECEKAPLKFPQAETDSIYMISYMVGGNGFLIVNRGFVSKDIEDFEYTPKPQYRGPFRVFNEMNEESLLRRFISHIQRIRPHVIVTYNGDFFDWPFVDMRCLRYGISLYNELGIRTVKSRNDKGITSSKEYIGRCIVHLDAYNWVRRDSYLPQGSQGLKSVTKFKLGYDPVEVDPEYMLEYARLKPDVMATYSVSDAVATYYLYTTYVHNFIFSMSTIIPMGSENVLRKGSGTLCESLLMVEAYRGNIICPNQNVEDSERFHKGHLVESETYIGGHVECLEAGVFRSDIPVQFDLKPSAFQHLINNIDRDLMFALETEHDSQRSDVVNYDQVRQAVIGRLEALRDNPIREEKPVIYHLDVGAMYPNIILTNRLQPSSIVSSSDCAACDFNREINKCKRHMKWLWRGDYSPAGRSEYEMIKRQLSFEKINGKSFVELSEKEKHNLIRKRLRQYSDKVFKKMKVTTTEERVNTICMRENPFYVNTVRAFRDRRYEYKLLTKKYKVKKNEAEKNGNFVERKLAEEKEVLMDSLQLAHKCILNSFYGYVMRKGARWRSMEMAGIVTNTGSQLITQARELIEQVGRPLELDTDGIWAILPFSFPQDFKFVTKNGKKISIGYPCVMLNADVHERYTNHQYQTLRKNIATGITTYCNNSECSIFFELDGPYKAMILPASPEEGKLLKKKYAVYNFDGSLAELKGFELKRKGELEVVKIFQSQVFDKFLLGESLHECYEAVGAVGNKWLDILHDAGRSVDKEELLELISEKKTISKTVQEYEGRRATSLTTAQRLADFLGSETVKDKGLSCNLIISRYPSGAPIADRAIPVAIFSADLTVRNYYLRKWLKEPELLCDEPGWSFRDLVDWTYYVERLGKTIQKIITIPAGLQGIENPCPRVAHPMWLERFAAQHYANSKQVKISAHFPVISAKGCKGLSWLPNTTKKNAVSGRKLSCNADDVEELHSSAHKIIPSVPFLHDADEGTNNHLSESQDFLDKYSLVIFPYLPNERKERESWLVDRKYKWTFLRSKKVATPSTPIRNAAGMSVGEKRSVDMLDFIHNATCAAIFGVWQIIEIQEMNVPGEFCVWAITHKNQLQRFSLMIPKIFYVNVNGSGPAEKVILSLGGQRMIRDLPKRVSCSTLYEVRMEANKFFKYEKLISSFTSDPQVEGVYEMNTPLLFRGILKLGCVSKVVKRSKQAESGRFKLDDLESWNINSSPYMDKDVCVYKRLYIYYVVDKSRESGLGAIALFIMNESNDSPEGEFSNTKAYIWLSNMSGIADTRPPFQRIFSKFCPDERRRCSFVVSFTKNMTEALSGCDERLSLCARNKRGPTIAIVQGSMGSASFRRMLPRLKDFPVVCVPVNLMDEQFPALNWQMFVSERIIQRFVHFPEWFHDRVECARYAHVPIANLGDDATMTMTDVIFARQLLHNRHLLWVSKSNEHSMLEDDHNELWLDIFDESSSNQSGAYRCVCVELNVSGMAVASILSSSHFDHQTKFCSRAFDLLKAVVVGWVHNFNSCKDLHAFVLSQSLYRFLCGHSKVLLYDSSLHQLVYGLMLRMLQNLLMEFKRLGADIVYANFERIVLNTKKREIAAAQEYVQYILSTVLINNLFTHLQLTVSCYFEQLLWIDPDNYCALCSSLPNPLTHDVNYRKLLASTCDDVDNNFHDKKDDDYGKREKDCIQSGEEKTSSKNKETSFPEKVDNLEDLLCSSGVDVLDYSAAHSLDCRLQSKWNLAKFLPPIVSGYFELIVGRFITHYTESWDRVRHHKNLNSIDKILQATQDEMRQFVRKELSDNLLAIVHTIERTFSTLPRGGMDSFPTLVGSHLVFTSPSLEFVKSVCHVLGLDMSVMYEVNGLRRALLAQVKSREFSCASEFIDPCLSYILRDVVCAYCNTCRSLDLLRNDQCAFLNRMDRWKCNRCQQKFQESTIENRLIKEVERVHLQYMLQDTRCASSHGSSRRITSSRSDVLAPLSCSISQTDYNKRMDLFFTIAQYYEFLFLKELLEKFLVNCPN